MKHYNKQKKNLKKIKEFKYAKNGLINSLNMKPFENFQVFPMPFQTIKTS